MAGRRKKLTQKDVALIDRGRAVTQLEIAKIDAQITALTARKKQLRRLITNENLADLHNVSPSTIKRAVNGGLVYLNGEWLPK